MPPVPPQKLAYSMGELARLVLWAGFRGTSAAIAVSVIMAESGGRRLARHVVGREGGRAAGSVDRGLSQINSYWHPEVSDRCAYDTYCNLQQFWRISGHGRNFRPWSTFNSGAYRQFFGAAAGLVAGAHADLSTIPPPNAAELLHPSPSTMEQAMQFIGRALSWGPLGWIERHIEAIVSAAGHYIYDKLHLLIHVVGKTANHAVQLYKALRSAVTSTFHKLTTWAHKEFSNVKKWVTVGLSSLKRLVIQWVNDTREWVRRDIWGPLNRAWHATVDWVKSTVIPFFQRALAALSHALARIRDFLLDLIRRVEKWAKDAVAWIIDHVREAVDWVRHFGAKVWGIIDKCWWFLVFVATHPLDWWIILLRDLAGQVPQVLAGVATRAMQTVGDDIERVIARWLGGD